MNVLFTSVALAAALMTSADGFAQAPAQAPAGTTGLCKDGSYYSGPTKKGACSKHGGVKDWYGTTEAKAATTPPPAAAAAPAPVAPAAAPKAAAAPMKPATTTAAMTPAAGGGAGKVWVNSSSKVYHCDGSKWYGTTKKGEYMTEAAAKAAGNHADHGKACS
jgi:Protein of unknown function (DUF3761)